MGSNPGYLLKSFLLYFNSQMKIKILLQKTIEPMILPSNCDHQQWPIQDYQSDDETCTSSAITTSPVSGQPRQSAWLPHCQSCLPY